jgi:hypothetical protein
MLDMPRLSTLGEGPIDTLAYAEALIEAGIAENHAKAHAKAMRNHVLPDLATRHDMERGFADLRSEMRELRAAMEKFHAETYQRMWQVAVAAVLAAVTLNAAVSRLFR